MTTRHSIQWVILAFLLLTVAAPAAESLSVLLQKGIFAEETEGNLDAAIKIYEGIVKETEANRSLAAQAQYRLGKCYQKKGKKDEAATAFRNLLDRFSDQSELAIKTREHLSELGHSAMAPIVRQIWGSAIDADGSISSDGRFYAHVDWDTGNLAIRDLKSGKNRNLTDKAGWTSSSEFAMHPRFSRDGRQVAYCWFNRDEVLELRVVSIDSPTPRTLTRDCSWDYPGDWSPDGNQFLITIQNAKMKEEIIAMASVEDGSLRYIKTNAPPHASRILFEPEGRFLVFSREPSLDSEQRDIFMMDLANGSESPLVRHPADDSVVGWVPNSQTLLFVSDRRGTKDLWSIDIMSGKVKDEPRLLRANFGDVSALGMTQHGALYYGVSSGGVDMARAVVDFTTGKVLVPPRVIPRPSGHSLLRMNLSPNGRQLAYYVSQRAAYSHPALFLLDLETQQSRKIHVWDSGDLVDIPYWLPNNRTLLHRATRKDGRKDLSFVDTGSAAVTPITLVDKSPTPFGIPLVLTEDAITYVRQDPKAKSYWLVRRSLKSGEETEVGLINDPDPDTNYGFEIDVEERAVLCTRNPSGRPQGQASVAVRFDWETSKSFEWLRTTNRMQVLPGPKAGLATVALTQPNRDLELKQFRIGKDRADELWTAKPSGVSRIFVRGWTPDGRYLLCMDKDRRWWSISAENGEARKTELSTPKFLQLMSIHPDSQQIFFTLSEPSVNEVWAMENFLPPVASAN